MIDRYSFLAQIMYYLVVSIFHFPFDVRKHMLKGLQRYRGSLTWSLNNLSARLLIRFGVKKELIESRKTHYQRSTQVRDQFIFRYMVYSKYCVCFRGWTVRVCYKERGSQTLRTTGFCSGSSCSLNDLFTNYVRQPNC